MCFGFVEREFVGSKRFLQTLFQNIYQNTLRYGKNTKDLRSTTTFAQKPFSAFHADFALLEEPPDISQLWVN